MKRCPICARSYPPEEAFCSIHGLPLVEERVTLDERKGDLTGELLEGRYRLGGIVGAGGMGVVYDAEHLRIGRRCAVKVLQGTHAADAKLRMRFFREVRATARIHHPNVVEILDYGETESVGSFMVMEFLEGTTLAQLIEARGALPLPTACSIMVQLCSALGATHARGLLHRDLKPGNVIQLSNGRIKVLDFGLVKPLDEDAHTCVPSLTTDGMVMGTPYYMSPEHYMGELIDARADVYALGIIFYEMLVGQPPFSGTTPLAILEAQLHAPVPLPSGLEPNLDLPGSVDLVLLKALAKKREERYQSTAELADAMFDLADELGFQISDSSVTAVRSKAASDVSRARREEPDTLEWEGPIFPDSEKTPQLVGLHELASSRRDELVERVVASLLNTFPRYRTIDQEDLHERVALAIEGAIKTLAMDSIAAKDGKFDLPAVDAYDEQVHLTEAIVALWLGYTECRPLLIEASGGDIERFERLAASFDRRILPFFFHVADRYVSASQGSLQRLNQVLARRNEELQSLRHAMSEEVATTGRQLADAERLKARVVESVASGMMLVERNTRRVLLWNGAMEKMSGVPESQIIGRSLDEVAHLVDGVPFDEFADQIRYRQEVGLRKLRLRFRNKEERSIYVSGQPFHSASGDHVGTLFVLEDVTEREQIIESLGRYLSKDLVDRILSRSGPVEPEGEQRTAVVLSARVRNFGAALEKLSPSGVVQLLSEYVRAVARAVFRRGGTIERIGPDGLVAFFARLGDSTDAAIGGAIELAQRLERVGEDLASDGSPPFEVAVGLHLGDVLVLNVGGEGFMVQTVVGEAATAAEALRDAAGDGEILVGPQIARQAGDNFPLEPGPSVTVPGRAEPLASSRVLFELNPDLDEDPITHVTEVRKAPLQGRD